MRITQLIFLPNYYQGHGCGPCWDDYFIGTGTWSEGQNGPHCIATKEKVAPLFFLFRIRMPGWQASARWLCVLLMISGSNWSRMTSTHYGITSRGLTEYHQEYLAVWQETCVCVSSPTLIILLISLSMIVSMLLCGKITWTCPLLSLNATRIPIG